MKLDRLIGILTVLLQNKKITAPELAQKFEVSRRTILRDIDTLAMAGIPITSMRGGGGGIAIMEGYKINNSVLTSDELQSLIAALKGLDSVSEKSYFESLMRKLAPTDAVVSLTDNIVIDLSGYYKDSLSEKITIIKQAITQRRTVEFDYYYAKGETQREIEPYFIEFRWKSWYVFGWCGKREDFRRFKLNRLWNLTLTDNHFVKRNISADKASADDVFTEDNNIQILFDKSVRFRLIEDYGLDSFEETNDSLIMSLDYTNKEYIFGWVLSFGDKAEILSPLEIRKEFAEILEKTFLKY